MENLSEEAITELAKKMQLKEVAGKVNSELELFVASLDSSRIAKIDSTYTNLIRFVNFCQFDYYFMLKKFDSGLREHNFSNSPKFSSINGNYIIEDLRNFADVAFSISFESQWEEVLKLIKRLKGVDPISLGVWKKVLNRVRYLKENKIIEMLIQLVSEDPYYRDETVPKDLHIADDYLSDIRKQVDSTISNLKQKQTEDKIESLLVQVFGTSEVEKLKFYNEAGSAPFERKELGRFEYCEPLSYLKKFIIDYGKTSIKELSDILLVRGKWANQQLSTPMSESFHQLMEIADKIISLDKSLDESVDLGLKMKTHLPRSERDKEARNIIHSTLNFINNSAAQLIKSAIALFVTYDKNLKMVLEDCVKQHPTLIINWKEIDHFAEEKLRQMCIDVYKAIFAFVSLLQNFHVEVHED